MRVFSTFFFVTIYQVIRHAGLLHQDETTDSAKTRPSYTYPAAKNLCNLHPMFVENLEHFSQCYGTMPDLQNLVVWLPILKRRTDGWMYPNGTFFSDKILLREIPGQDCTLIRTNDGFLGQDFCNTKATGYMCSLPVSTPTPANAERLQTERFVYAIFRETVTWFDAFMKCKALGLNLASIDSDEVLRKKTIEDIQENISKHGHFFMAMVHSIYVLDYNDQSNQVSIDEFHWTKDQPDHEHQCAVAFFNSSWQWKTSRCTERHHAVCSYDLFGRRCGDPLPERPTYKKEFQRNEAYIFNETLERVEKLLIALVIMIPLIAVFALSMMVGIIFWIWKNCWQNVSMKTQMKQNPAKEQDGSEDMDASIQECGTKSHTESCHKVNMDATDGQTVDEKTDSDVKKRNSPPEGETVCKQMEEIGKHMYHEGDLEK